jgi:integrase
MEPKPQFSSPFPGRDYTFLNLSCLYLSLSHFSLTANTTKSKKTKKCMASRPVVAEIMNVLSKYVYSLDVGQEKLFKRKFNHRIWRKICDKAGLADLKFHDLRRTFCSLLAQNGVLTAITQRLLEHSSPNLTNKVYTNVDPVLRQVVEQLPVGKWL